MLTMPGDLCVLFCSPTFLYTISPRVKRAQPSFRRDSVTQDTPNDNSETNACSLDLSHLSIRTEYDNRSWATQLMFADQMLLEGRQLNVDEEDDFCQSFLWFCYEASFLAYEFKAKDNALAERMGCALTRSRHVILKGEVKLTQMMQGKEVFRNHGRIVVLKGGHRLAQLLRSNEMMRRPALKLKIRLRNLVDRKVLPRHMN